MNEKNQCFKGWETLVIKPKVIIMESDKVNHILMMLSSKIPAGSIPSVRTRLENTDISESEILALHSQMKDPLLSILLSIFIGSLGIDRFYIGDVGLGIGKLLTAGGCGIWWLIDIFLITDATKQKNLEQLSYYLR